MKSSRIKRRNACGFKGEGTSGNWVKTSPWGKWDATPSKRFEDKQREIGKNGNRNLRGRGPSLTLKLIPPKTIIPYLV